MFFNTEINERLLTNDKHFAPSTIESFNDLIKRLFVKGLKVDTFKVKLLKTKAPEILEYIQGDELNLNIKKNMLNAIKNVLKVSELSTDKKLYDLYDAKFKVIAKEAEEARNYPAATEEEEEKKISFEDIKKMFLLNLKEYDNMKIHWKNDTATLLLGFFVYLPILRNQDYVSLRILTKPKDKATYPNYINFTTGEIVIRDFKTKKSMDERHIPIPAELQKLIENKYKKSNNNAVLFPKQNNPQENMSVSSLTHFINGLFGKKISIQILRQIYVSDMINNNVKRSTRKATAATMGHSMITADSKYSKFTENNKD